MDFHLKYETKRAYELLQNGKLGDTISREQITRQIGMEAWSGPGYRYVRSAMERAIKNGTYWYRDKHGSRYVCGQVDDINKAQVSLIRQSSKRAKKSLDVAACVKTEEMTKDQLSLHNLNTLMAGLIMTASSPRTRKQLEGKKVLQPDPNALLQLVIQEPK